MAVLGLDIGLTGGIAILSEDGGLVDVMDMPVLRDGPSGRPAVNAALLAGIVARAGAASAYVELVGPRPGEGAVQGFSFGRARGIVEGVLAAAGIPVTFIAPAAWKRTIGIAPGKAGAKDAARSEAIRRWPAKAELFALKKSDGLAEAALIAVAGVMRASRPVEGDRGHGHLPADKAAPRALGVS
jgi:crossover junction endodeoxyribonuclease RuvC